MEGIGRITNRLDWTRAWLNDFRKDATAPVDGFELVNVDDCLPEHEVVVQNDDENNDMDGFALVTNTELFMLPIDKRPRRRSQIPDYELAYWEGLRFELLSYDDRSPSLNDEEWERFGIHDLPEEQQEILFGTLSKKVANKYELAGRVPEHTFRDLRSARKACDRRRTQSERYYGFREINLGQVGKPHCASRDLCGNAEGCRDPFLEVRIVKMTAQDLYHQAQMWPRPPKRHRRRSRKLKHYLWQQKRIKHLASELDPRTPHIAIEFGESDYA